MCDFFSWIEKDGKLYYLTDAMIESRWPNDEVRNKIGHSAIEEYFGIKGEHKENAIDLPIEIAREVNRGRMTEMAKAGGWAGVRYNDKGHINSPWWMNVETFIEKLKSNKWFDSHGEIKKGWKVFETYSAADSAARSVADSVARSAAYSEAYSEADSVADSAADSAVCILSLPVKNKHRKYIDKIIDVYFSGYGFYADIDNKFWVYKKPV